MIKQIWGNNFLDTRRNKRRSSQSRRDSESSSTTTSSITSRSKPKTVTSRQPNLPNSNINDAAQSNVSSHRRSKLRFKSTIQIREYSDDSYKDESHKKSIWYSDEDYAAMEATNTKVVKLMMTQSTSPNNLYLSENQQRTIRKQLDGHTPRGLERMTPDAWDRTQDVREEAVYAVLREQFRQQKHNVYDQIAISNVYRKVTSKSKREATDSGLRDERFICNEFGPLEPIGMRHDDVDNPSLFVSSQHATSGRSGSEQNIEPKGTARRSGKSKKRPDPD